MSYRLEIWPQNIVFTQSLLLVLPHYCFAVRSNLTILFTLDYSKVFRYSISEISGKWQEKGDVYHHEIFNLFVGEHNIGVYFTVILLFFVIESLFLFVYLRMDIT